MGDDCASVLDAIGPRLRDWHPSVLAVYAIPTITNGRKTIRNLTLHIRKHRQGPRFHGRRDERRDGIHVHRVGITTVSAVAPVLQFDKAGVDRRLRLGYGCRQTAFGVRALGKLCRHRLHQPREDRILIGVLAVASVAARISVDTIAPVASVAARLPILAVLPRGAVETIPDGRQPLGYLPLDPGDRGGGTSLHRTVHKAKIKAGTFAGSVNFGLEGNDAVLGPLTTDYAVYGRTRVGTGVAANANVRRSTAATGTIYVDWISLKQAIV